MKGKKGKKKEKEETEKDSGEPPQKPEAGVVSTGIWWKERWCVGCAIFVHASSVYTSPTIMQEPKTKLSEVPAPMEAATYCNFRVQTCVVLEGCAQCWFWEFRHQD